MKLLPGDSDHRKQCLFMFVVQWQTGFLCAVTRGGGGLIGSQSDNFTFLHPFHIATGINCSKEKLSVASLENFDCFLPYKVTQTDQSVTSTVGD